VHVPDEFEKKSPAGGYTSVYDRKVEKQE